MPKYIYLYGPDGSGKTAIALEIKKLFPDTILIPFEPFNLKKRSFDSGYNGEDSASNSKTNKFYKSFLLFFRYVLNDILFKIRHLFSKEKYVVYTRGVLEFGINHANKKFPLALSKFYQKLMQKNSILVISEAKKIVERKNELKQSDIIDLYLKYFSCNIDMIENISSLKKCACQVLKK